MNKTGWLCIIDNMKKIILSLSLLGLAAGAIIFVLISAHANAANRANIEQKTGINVASIITTTKTTPAKAEAKDSSSATVKATAKTTKAAIKPATKPAVKTATKPAVKKTTKAVVKPATTVSRVSWASSGLKAVAKIPSGVRPAYKKKVEAYARRNNIKLITATVVAGMRE